MPDDRTSVPRIVRFGVFDVDARSGELRKAGRRIALQEQPFRVLLALLERPGELVGREELRHTLWPDDTFVDFEHGLNAAIKRLRDALGDAAENPRFIETLPRRGYRFIAPLRDVDNAPPRQPRPGPSRSRVTALVLGLVLFFASATVAALAGSSCRQRTSEAVPSHTSARASGHLVAVAVFDNQTNDPGLDPLGRLIADQLIRAARRVSAVQVVAAPVDPADDAQRHGITGKTGAASDAPDVLVSGTYYLHAARLEVQARIVDGASGRLLHSLAVSDVERAPPREGLDRLGDTLAGALATHFDDFFGGLDVISHVPDLTSYNEYRAGLELFQSDFAGAIGHLDRAIAATSSFVPAQVVLLFAYWNQGDQARADALVAGWREAWQRLSPAERLLVEFMTHSHEGRHAAALGALTALEPLVPRSLVVQFNLAQMLRATNRPRAAVEAYTRLAFDERQLRHSIGTYRHGELCLALHMLGEYEQELAAARRAQGHQPDNLVFARAAVRALAALGRIDQAVREANESRSKMAGSGVTPGDVMEEAALELRAHGHRASSIEVARRAVEWHRTRADAATPTRDDRWALARALYLAERWDDARVLYGDLSRTFPEDVRFTGPAGAIAARQGNHGEARAVLAKLRQGGADETGGLSMFAAAGIAALLEERDEAANLLHEAFARGLLHGLHLHRDLDLEPLRTHPSYLALIKPKG